MNSMFARLMSVLLVAGVGGFLLTEISETWFRPETQKPVSEQTVLNEVALVESVDFSRPENVEDWSSPEEMHDVYTKAFVESRGFGMERILTFETPSFRPLFVNGKPFRVERMELVSLMHEQPIAYHSTWLNATRDQLDILRQRPVSDFETTAISQLKQGRSFVWNEPQPDALQESHLDRSGTAYTEVVFKIAAKSQGTLMAEFRASGSCLTCHQVREGTLMGAFVYQLVPIPQLDPVEQMSGLQ